MSKVLTIQDFSCYGQCSLTVAIPLLSAIGIETVSLPTAVLSTHTSGFKNFRVHDLSNFLKDILNHWKEEHLLFDALYTGYLGTSELVDTVKYLKDNYLVKDAVIIIDPAMGDKGKLYPAFDIKYAKKMQELLDIGDIILPNVTEACYLSDIFYKEDYDEEFIKELLIKLRNKGAKNIILTDVSFDKDTTGVYSYINNKFDYYKHQKLGEGYHGTGDIFASTFTGIYLKTKDIYKAIKLSADFVYRCILNTLGDDTHLYGVKFEPQIKYLIEEINK